MFLNLRLQRGFSLVELVTVLALLGIISAVAFARLGDVSSFRSSVFQQQVLSYLRLAQRTAVAHQGSGAQLVIGRTSNTQWMLTLQFAGQTVSYPLEGRYRFSYAGSGASGMLTAGDSLTLVYQDTGNLVQLQTPTALPVNGSVALAIEDARYICISPAGFSYDGACL